MYNTYTRVIKLKHQIRRGSIGQPASPPFIPHPSFLTPQIMVLKLTDAIVLITSVITLPPLTLLTLLLSLLPPPHPTSYTLDM